MDSRLQDLYAARELLLNGGSLLEKAEEPESDVLPLREILRETQGNYEESIKMLAETIGDNKISSLRVQRDAMGLIESVEVLYE